MPTIQPMLGDLRLEQLQRIEIDEGHVLAQHEIPASEGDFLQRLGRRGSTIVFSGVLTGPESGKGLQALREKFRASEPVSFISDITTATKVNEVLIEELNVLEVAGRPERFEYSVVVREFTEAEKVPTEPPQEKLPSEPVDAIDRDLGTLLVEVIVEGEPGFDSSSVIVTARGTQEKQITLERALTDRKGSRWTDEGFPAGEFTVEAVTNGLDALSGSATVVVRPGETSTALIALESARAIARVFLVHFRFNKAFLEPSMREVLRQVVEYASAHRDEKLLIVGHTDLAGSDRYNQSLSERRARCVYAHLSFGRDPASALDELEHLRRPATGALPSVRDTWGTRQYQHILQDLRFFPGNVDGQHGSKTDTAVRAFQEGHALAATGVVDDPTWRALLEDYLAQDMFSVPENQFFPNADDIVRWLGCGEQDPVRNTRDAWRPNRRVECLFVRAHVIPCEVPRPDTFDLPVPGVAGSSWALGPGDTNDRCCFTTRDPAVRDRWLIRRAEPETILVNGRVRFEDGSGLAGGRYALIAPDGEFMDGERPGGPDGGEAIPGRTSDEGVFSYSRPKGVRVFTLEMEGPFLIRLVTQPTSATKGNILGIQIAKGAQSSDFDVVISSPASIEDHREVTVLTEGTEAPLPNVWVYWRVGNDTQVLRTNGLGRLRSLRTGGNPTAPRDHRERFTAEPGSDVELYVSSGGRPIPIPILTAGGDPFLSRTLSPAPQQPAQTTQVQVPQALVQLTTPSDLSIWPLLWELPTDAYHTDGLAQGAALWVGGDPQAAPGPVGENDHAPAPSAAVRPRERFLKVNGRIDGGATGVVVQVLDASGSPVQVRTAHGSAAVQQITATLGPAAGTTRPFEAAVLFVNAAALFGPVQVVARSTGGLTPLAVNSVSVDLYGFQIALVDDPSAAQRGALLGEADERVVVDFLASPQSGPLANISNQTRARRMVPYQIRHANRPLDFANLVGPANPSVVKPQMPMWMSEFNIVGLTQPRLENLMSRIYFRQHGSVAGLSVSLQFDLEWGLQLSWDGPDSNSPAFATDPTNPISRPGQFHEFAHLFLDNQTVILRFDQQGMFIDSTGARVQVGAGGEVPNSFSNPPPQLDQPVAGRRKPQVVVTGPQRPWGRHAAASQLPTLLVEHQPDLVQQPEIIRGGDGFLELFRVAIDGQDIDEGFFVDASGDPVPPLPDQADLRLPHFRVRGENPPEADVNTLINALVEEFFNANSTVPRVSFLTLAMWQVTARLIIFHESLNGRHFDDRGAGRRRFRRSASSTQLRYGHEDGMPVFGAPHGYGFGQLDLIFGRGPNEDEVWSFLENIRSAVRVIMEEKATPAFNLFTQPVGDARVIAFNALPMRRRRAMYRREVVRRYNGFGEFRFQSGNWVIQTASNRREYPNGVLNTNVAYPGPTQFQEADFGPGI